MAVQSLRKRVSHTPNTTEALHALAVELFSGELNNLASIQASSASTMEIVSSLSKIDDDVRSIATNDASEQVSIQLN